LQLSGTIHRLCSPEARESTNQKSGRIEVAASGTLQSSSFKQRSGDFSVDWGHLESQSIEAEGLGWPVAAAKSEAAVAKAEGRVGNKQTWTLQESLAEVKSDYRRQQVSNSVLHAIEKARSRAILCGESQPPLAETLDDDLLLPSESLTTARALSARARILDTGASRGMAKTSKAVGKPVPGPTAKITTGAGVISSGAWCKETLPMGTFTHIG